MTKTPIKQDRIRFQTVAPKMVQLRRILAFILLASEDRRRVATLFSNTHVFFENDPEKIREYGAVKCDFEWWWRLKNGVKQFIKERFAKW